MYLCVGLPVSRPSRARDFVLFFPLSLRTPKAGKSTRTPYPESVIREDRAGILLTSAKLL